MNYSELIIAFFFLIAALGFSRGSWFSPRRTRHILVFLSLFAGLRYMLWRGFQTLNTADPAAILLSSIVYAAELYGFLAVLFFYIQAVEPPERVSEAWKGPKLPTIDVFVTTYNESKEILTRTLVACDEMDYPPQLKKVYVLDDGSRDEIRQLAKELNCFYISRENNLLAKAGNLNNALQQTAGEFIAVFDCDHIPVRSFLTETIGFFNNLKLAFVQTPHYFYNRDVFQKNLALQREILNEEDLFFYLLEPGKDRHNSAFFAGSGALFRRKALDESGGFQTLSLAEDLHTSLVIHSKGYESVYLNKTLSAGLAPESFRSHLKQRQRWTRGGVKIFIADNPLFKKSLTLMQKVNYFASLFYFFHGWARLIYLIAPLFFLLFQKAPVVTTFPLLMAYYLPYYFVSMVAFNRIGGKYRNPFWSDVYETAMCFHVSWTAFETLLKPRKYEFHVTPKKERFNKTILNIRDVLPHLLTIGLLAAGILIGGYRFWFGHTLLDSMLISVFWSLYNGIMLIAAIGVARERPQLRASDRIVHKINCEVRFSNSSFQSETADISESGLALSLDRPLRVPEEYAIQVAHRSSGKSEQDSFPMTLVLDNGSGKKTELSGEIVRHQSALAGSVRVGIKFGRVRNDQRHELIRHIYTSPSLWKKTHEEKQTSTWKSLQMIGTAVIGTLKKEPGLKPYSLRLRGQVRCEITAEGGRWTGKTQDISSTGLSVFIETDELLPKIVEISLDHEKLKVRYLAEVVWTSVDKEKEGIRVGLRYIKPLTSWDPSILEKSGDHPVPSGSAIEP